jgi:signal transduction histidine kinase
VNLVAGPSWDGRDLDRPDPPAPAPAPRPFRHPQRQSSPREPPPVIATEQVLLFDADPGRAASIIALLEQAVLSGAGGSIRAFADLNSHHGTSSGAREIQGGRTALIVVVEDAAFAGLADVARQAGVPSLLVVDKLGDAREVVGRVKAYDEWVAFDALDRELPGRVAGLLGRLDKGPTPLPAIDPRFLALVIHDLRTPLNVIGLTIRAIAQTVPQRTAELDEDLTFLTDNARQIEKMLAQLGDYCRLIEAESQLSAVEFDPRRFLADFLEDRRGRPGSEPTTVRLEVLDDGPGEVALDPQRVRLALQHALANAINAAGDAPVRVRSGGEGGRWVVEMVVDKPPPATVASIALKPDRFERLAGSAAERRGLDLAIAARVSEMFGGSARLDVEPGRRSTVVLDWPRRLA